MADACDLAITEVGSQPIRSHLAARPCLAVSRTTLLLFRCVYSCEADSFTINFNGITVNHGSHACDVCSCLGRRACDDQHKQNTTVEKREPHVVPGLLEERSYMEELT